MHSFVAFSKTERENLQSFESAHLNLYFKNLWSCCNNICLWIPCNEKCLIIYLHYIICNSYEII